MSVRRMIYAESSGSISPPEEGLRISEAGEITFTDPEMGPYTLGLSGPDREAVARHRMIQVTDAGEVLIHDPETGGLRSVSLSSSDREYLVTVFWRER